MANIYVDIDKNLIIYASIMSLCAQTVNHLFNHKLTDLTI